MIYAIKEHLRTFNNCVFTKSTQYCKGCTPWLCLSSQSLKVQNPSSLLFYEQRAVSQKTVLFY